MTRTDSLLPDARLVLARLACWANGWGNLRSHPSSYDAGYRAAMSDLGAILRPAAGDWIDVWRTEGWGLGMDRRVLAPPFTEDDYALVKAREDEIFGGGGAL